MNKMFKKLIKEDIKPNDWEFEFQQRNKQTVLMADWWCRSFYHHMPVEIKFEVPPLDYLMTGTNRGYVKKDQKREVIEKLAIACKGDDYLLYVMKQTIARVAELDTLANKVEQAFKDDQISYARLVELWNKLDAVLIRVIPWFYIPWYISEYNILTDRVRDGLVHHSNKLETIADPATALITVIFPTKPAAFQREQVDFYDLVRLAQTNKQFATDKVFKQKANVYLKKYDWIVTFPLLPLPPLTYEGLIDKVKQAIKDNSIVEFQRQQKAKVENETKARVIIKVLQSDKRLLKDIEWAQELGYVLTASVEEATRSAARYQYFFREVASRLSLSEEELGYFTSSEIVDGLKNKKLADQKILKQRKNGYVFTIFSGVEQAAFGKEAIALTTWIDQAITLVDGDVEELKGQTASPGYARGVVKIAPTPQDSYLLKEGEILVCSMTGPDYVSAMKRAAAIVTDEGGLLSHASIMSREFGKPCVIATKIATKVLKDGMVVEVDADDGVVRIVK